VPKTSILGFDWSMVDQNPPWDTHASDLDDLRRTGGNAGLHVERGGVDSILNMNMAQFIAFVRRNLLVLLLDV
jgi:hypothetical protein